MRQNNSKTTPIRKKNRRRNKLVKGLLALYFLTIILSGIVICKLTTRCEHHYEAIVNREATCTEEGELKYTCVNCGDTYTEEMPKLESDWVMTNYPDESGCQGMFYTFYNRKDGYLMVIDGGQPENTNTVRNVITAYGGHVDLWIITHYHRDHVSPLNQIIKEPQGITIDQVYASPMDYDYYAFIAEEKDNIECFTEFLKETENTGLVRYVNANEEYSVDGLKLYFINAYSQETKQYGYIPNNGSLAFTIRGQEDSILFCADCESNELAQSWITKYGNKIKTKYVQLGHHGNSEISCTFYDYVNPQIVIFDAPESLMEADEPFQAKGLKEHLEGEGITCWDFTSGPHQFEFK